MFRVLEKQLNILDFALSSLWRRKVKNLCIMLVFMAVIFLLASFQMITKALTDAAEGSLKSTPEITIQKMSAGRQEAIPIAYREKLDSIFGIRSITPRIWGYYFDEAKLANYTVMGIDLAGMPAVEQLHLALENGNSSITLERGDAFIGRSVHKVMELEGRNIFSLFRPDLSLKSFTLKGVFDQQTDILTNDLIVMGLDDARDLFLIPPDMATDLIISVANPNEITTIAKKIAALLPDTRVLTRPQIQKTYKVVFGWRSGFGSICLLTALIAFAILAWDKASGLSPEEKREIGILKILGWETTHILAVRFWESFLIATLAFVCGCTLAYIHTSFFDAALFRPIMVGWSIIYPPFKLTPGVTLADLMLIFSFSVLPYMAATVIPAWRSATVRADSAI
jgi:ABC-type lipoprotein release transport system permease subunit